MLGEEGAAPFVQREDKGKGKAVEEPEHPLGLSNEELDKLAENEELEL
jgi:hypothetical protein